MTDVRLASEVDAQGGYSRFPYAWPGKVCYLELCDGKLLWLKARDETREAVRRAIAGESTIYAAWPGQHRTDLFLIDSPERLAVALKMDVAA